MRGAGDGCPGVLAKHLKVRNRRSCEADQRTRAADSRLISWGKSRAVRLESVAEGDAGRFQVRPENEVELRHKTMER